MARRAPPIALACVVSLLWPLPAAGDFLITTTEDRATGEKLASHVQDQFGRRIEHVHFADIHTHYRWQGEVKEEEEVRITFDSDVPFDELRDAVQAAHLYEVPMIISAAAGGTLIGNKGQSDLYLMASADINGTTLEEVSGLTRELVETRFVACSHIEQLEGVEDTFRIWLKTTRAKKEHLVREFGGLDFNWTPIRGNQAYLEWLDKSVEADHREL
mmetsp:Transcript_53124/g.153296  ORF Transcript_53124/g.153296 Transcript_53124/m.153296 type:complete len:216 (+) Transcript_53124:68-715(+)